MHDIDDEDDVPGGWVKLDRQTISQVLALNSQSKKPNPTHRTVPLHA